MRRPKQLLNPIEQRRYGDAGIKVQLQVCCVEMHVGGAYICLSILRQETRSGRAMAQKELPV
jgi:hypothetical protein